MKERHLLRQKKIKEQQEQKQKQKEEEEKAARRSTRRFSLKPRPVIKQIAQNSLQISSAYLQPSQLQALVHLGYLPLLGRHHLKVRPALGLFGSGFALSTPASELLRKLQHKVQSKSPEDYDLHDKRNVGLPSEGYQYIN